MFVVEALTRVGSPPLAEKWRSHYQAFKDAAAVLASAIDRNDVAAAEAAHETMNDAQEAYERVEADVHAFLQRAEKGGQ